MTGMTRRRFLANATTYGATLGVLGRSAAAALANPLGLPIGSQVWPHRALLADFPAFCRLMAEMGVTRLELCSPIGYGREFASLRNPQQVRQIMDEHGLKSESCHFSLQELRERQQECIAWAKAIGITQMITATLGDGNGDGSPTLDQIKAAAKEYSRIAAVAADQGIQQGLHNEDFEASVVEGRRTYDRLFDLLDEKLVKFQFQMSEISNGMVAADYFTKYPGRFFSMHVQDVDMKAPAPPAGRERSQVAVGKGSIDWTRTFTAARAAGVQNYFVEQDLELTRQSVVALRAMNV